MEEELGGNENENEKTMAQNEWCKGHEPGKDQWQEGIAMEVKYI